MRVTITVMKVMRADETSASTVFKVRHTIRVKAAHRRAVGSRVWVTIWGRI